MASKAATRKIHPLLTKRYLSCSIIVVLSAIILYRACYVYYQFKKLTISNFRLEEVRIVRTAPSKATGDSPYGLETKISFENSKCPLNFNILGLNAMICTNKKFLQNKTITSNVSKNKGNGTFISIDVDNLKFVKKKNFSFNARMKLQDFYFDRTLVEFLNSKHYIKITMHVRARFCYIPFWFKKDINPKKVQNNNNNDELYRWLRYITIRTFNKYPVPCIQIGIKGPFKNDFNLNIGCLRFVFDGLAKIHVFITSFSTAIYLSKAAVMQQYEEDMKRGETTAFHNTIPGELHEGEVCYYFITIPLFQNLSIAKFLKHKNIQADKSINLESVSVLGVYKVTGITPILKEYMKHEKNSHQDQSGGQNDSNSLNNKSNNEKNDRSETSPSKNKFIIETIVNNTFSGNKLLEKNIMPKDTLLKGRNAVVGGVQYKGTEKKIYALGQRHIYDTKPICSGDKQQLAIRPKKISDDKLLFSLLNTPRILSTVKSKYRQMFYNQKLQCPGVFVPYELNILNYKEVLFSSLKFSNTKENFSKNMELLKSNDFGFVKLPSFARLPLLKLLNKEEKQVSKKIIHIQNIKFNKNEISMVIALSRSPQVLKTLHNLCKIETVLKLMKAITISFDMFFEDSAHLGTCSLGFLESDEDNAQFRFNLKAHRQFTFNLKNILQIKFKFFKILKNDKLYASIDIFDLVVDYPHAICISDKYGNVGVLYKFSQSTSNISAQFTHVFLEADAGDYFTVTSNIDLCCVGMPLTGIDAAPFLFQNSYVSIDIPKHDFTATCSLFKLRSTVQKAYIQVSMSPVSGHPRFNGQLVFFSKVIVRNETDPNETFLTKIKTGTIFLALNDFLFKLALSCEDLMQINKKKKLGGENNEPPISNINELNNIQFSNQQGMVNTPYAQSLEKQPPTPFFRICPFLVELDPKNNLFDSGYNPCFKIRHPIKERVVVKPFNFHVRNIFKCNSLGYPIAVKSYILALIKIPNVSLALDFKSTGGLLYLLEPTSVMCVFPPTNEANDVFSKRVLRHCKLAKVLDFVFALACGFFDASGSENQPITEINNGEKQYSKHVFVHPEEGGGTNKGIPSNKVSTYTANERLQKKKEVESNNSDKETGTPVFKLFYENSRSFKGQIYIAIPKKMFIFNTIIDVLPAMNFAFKSATESTLNFTFAFKSNFTAYILQIDYSFPKKNIETQEIIVKVSSVYFTKFILVGYRGKEDGKKDSDSSEDEYVSFEKSTGSLSEVSTFDKYDNIESGELLQSPPHLYKDLLLPGHQHYVESEDYQHPNVAEYLTENNNTKIQIKGQCGKGISVQNLKQNILSYVLLIKSALESQKRCKSSINYSDQYLIHALCPEKNILPQEFIFEPNIDCNTTEEVKTTCPKFGYDAIPEILNLMVEGIDGTSNNIEIKSKVGIDAVVQDLGNILEYALSKVFFIDVPSHLNISINIKRVPDIKISCKEEDPFLQLECRNLETDLIIPIKKAERDIACLDNQVDAFIDTAKKNCISTVFIYFTVFICSDDLSMVVSQIHKSAEFEYSFAAPGEFLKAIYLVAFPKTTKIDDEAENTGRLRLRTSLADFPCVYLDIKFPYVINCVGEELTLFLDLNLKRIVVLRFKQMLFDPTMAIHGYYVSIPILLYPVKMNNYPKKMLAEDKNKVSFRCFWLHKKTRIVHNFYCSSYSFSLLNYLFYFISGVKSIPDTFSFVSTIVKQSTFFFCYFFSYNVGSASRFYFSNLPVYKDFGDRFTDLLSEERQLVCECLADEHGG